VMLSSANAPFFEAENDDSIKDAAEHQCAQQPKRINAEPHHEVGSNAEPVTSLSQGSS
jgi:hypothetical protein